MKEKPHHRELFLSLRPGPQANEKIFPSGKRIVKVYDPARLVQVQTPEGNIDLTYLCASTIGSLTQGAESIVYTYDGSLPTSESLAGTLNQTLVRLQ